MKYSSYRGLVSSLLAIIALGLMVGLVLVQSNPYSALPGRDSGFFLYAGRQILKGKLPYVDFWDSKSPGIFYINALGLWLGKDLRWGVWLLEYIFLMISAYLAYKGMAKKWGRAAALFGSAAWLYGFMRVYQGGNLTEEYSLTFNFLLLACFLETDGLPGKKLSLLIGVTFAISFLFRANNIGVQLSALIAITLSAFLSRQYHQIWKTAFWTGLGILLPFFLVGFYFFTIGLLSKMIEASILYNFYYSSAKSAFRLNVIDGFKHIGWPAFIALLGYFTMMYQIWRKRREKQLGTVFFFLLSGWPMEIVLSSISGKNYIHYFILWLPMIGVFNALGFTVFSDSVFSTKLLQTLDHPTRAYKLVLPALLLTYWTSGAWMQYKDAGVRVIFEREKGIELTSPVARFIRANTTEDDTVLVWGAYPVLNYLAKRDAPTPYLFYPVYEDSPLLEQTGRSYFQDLSTSMPKIIVDAYKASPQNVLPIDRDERRDIIGHYDPEQVYTPPYQDAVFDFVEKHYQRIENIQGFDIYQSISSLQPMPK